MKERVLVGFSGGIDSTMACFRLSEKGYEVIPVTLFFEGFHPENNIEKASEVAKALGLGDKHIVHQCGELFRREVIADFLGSYEFGLTPNPCVVCNEKVKFKILMEIADTKGCSKVATGHYARIFATNRGLRLCRGVDPAKDQSYMLYRLPKTFYSRLLFPHGNSTKREVQKEGIMLFPEIAKGMKESEDLCFLGKGELYNFLEGNLKNISRGPILSIEGKILGYHRGIHKYTIGQRQGLGLAGGPWYVVDKLQGENAIVVGRKEDLSIEIIHCTNAVLHEKITDGTMLAFKHRYKARPALGIISRTGEDSFLVKALKPVYGVAPGQSLVLYSASRVVGGGIIEKSVGRNGE